MMLLLSMKLPIRIPIAVDAHGPQIQDRLCAILRPAHAGLFHAVFDQMAAGTFHHAGANRPALRQVAVILHIGTVAHVIADGSRNGCAPRCAARCWSVSTALAFPTKVARASLCTGRGRVGWSARRASCSKAARTSCAVRR